VLVNHEQGEHHEPSAAFGDLWIVASKPVVRSVGRDDEAASAGSGSSEASGAVSTVGKVGRVTPGSAMSTAFSLHAAAENPFPTLLEMTRQRSFSYSSTAVRNRSVYSPCQSALWRLQLDERTAKQ